MLTHKIYTGKKARSQDFEKEGLFWKLETTVNELDRKFDQSWIRLR